MSHRNPSIVELSHTHKGFAIHPSETSNLRKPTNTPEMFTNVCRLHFLLEIGWTGMLPAAPSPCLLLSSSVTFRVVGLQTQT